MRNVLAWLDKPGRTVLNPVLKQEVLLYLQVFQQSHQTEDPYRSNLDLADKIPVKNKINSTELCTVRTSFNLDLSIVCKMYNTRTFTM